MLAEVCQELKNWFDVKRLYRTFTIANGRIDVPEISDGQYFRIIGSVFNDGVYRRGYNDQLVKDEVFNGAVWLLAIPKSVEDLSLEIDNWNEKYGESAASPYNSESFAGYSYTKGGGSGYSTAPTWASVFANRLNKWRKV